MSWSFPIATIRGTVVRIHVTFLILLAWVALAFLFKDGAGEAIGALVFTIALFGCVLLHEFGHVFAARAFGIRTPDITLLPIGGLARLEKMPEQPWQELIVAIAGPLVNVVIAIVLFVVLGIHGMPDLADPKMLTFTSLPSLLMRLMIINVWLVIFNLIPAFPMDGGRVLRALLAMAMPYAKATATAATVGQGFAVVGAIYGLFSGNFILMLIAMFIFFAARGESAMVSEREAIRGITLDQAMMTDFQTLPEHATLHDAVQHLLAGTQHDFPVLRPDGTLAGILTRQQLVRALAERGPDAPVAPFLVTDIPKIFPGTPLPRAIEILRESPAEVLPVLSADERQILGLISGENLAELLMIRQAVSGWHQR